MKITDLLCLQSIDLNASAVDKKSAIASAVDLVAKSGNLNDVASYHQAVLKRESEGSTGIGEGVAIPHAKSSSVKKATLAAMVFRGGVEFESFDGENVELLFMIAAPEGGAEEHLVILSKLSELLMKGDFVQNLIGASSKEEFLSIIDKAQNEIDAVENQQECVAKEAQIIAITACPTGIAHTYMAAQALQDKAREMGVQIKVETRGSSGVKNELSSQDIQNASAVIVAADTQVPLGRLRGKKVIFCKVADGIYRPKELLDEALGGNVEIYQAESLGEQSTSKEGNRIYKHLMNGVSHMLPFVVAGGILIALAFLVDGLFVDMQNASDGVKKAFGSNNELASFLMNLGKLAFGFMLPILSAFIAQSIADRPALLVGFVGGAIAGNGQSGFLGALLAGFLAGYLILWLKKAFELLPSSLDGLKTILFYPVFGTLLVGVLMLFVVEPPVGYLNQMLNSGLNSMSGEWKVLLGMLLGAMMATDLGGPINKAAYVFGVAGIASENYDIMAAVMVGGMVPPLAIAIATLLFPSRFTPQERKSGPTNFVMGFSFITEGAIPFAAADPLRVLGSCIVGSAVAGGMSMYFGCELRAPHGGIFVFPVVKSVGYYLLSLFVGSLIGACLLGILKKKIPAVES
ncbi:PTS fructose transporter subunit IIC [Helicobacter enhydrae]|uniref:PTS fructose transporter subunit IIC n=1 Tax=Helicobacter enhydrae TaxID=222136 RepID=A0A1B1U3N7_9HELI|nr:fructose-specific PTS transporter subunit EIIC [Helicobacter enhydrae]ANV97370.1 PTS fructose transporter subunit IIC [Helicobacter enhydrae]